MSNEQNKNSEQEAKDPMTKHQFYFDTPLYEVVALDELEEDVFRGEVDAYSAKNNTDTTYAIQMDEVDCWDVLDTEKTEHIRTGFFIVTLTCKRKSNDELRFFVFRNKKIALKVGQWPSLADLQFASIGRKYDGVLDEKSLAEFKRAIGLAAHGIGVGSFVYLRRIFEKLIFQTFDTYKSGLSVDKNDFAPKRMEDKVEILKDHLPSQLVEMKSIYSILSKGVHQLSEEECLAYFEPLKLSIELILDQKIELDLKQQRDAKVKQEIQNIHNKLGKE